MSTRLRRLPCLPFFALPALSQENAPSRTFDHSWWLCRPIERPWVLRGAGSSTWTGASCARRTW